MSQSWKGKSTIWLGKGSQNGKNIKIFAIDPHIGNIAHRKKHGAAQTFQEFQDNIQTAGLNDLVVPIVQTSEQAAADFTEPVEFIFIDGEHEYDFVKRDFELWFPRVIDGGIMAFHDTSSWPGPFRVVAENVYRSPYFKNIQTVDTITFAQKVASNSSLERIRHRFLLFKRSFRAPTAPS